MKKYLASVMEESFVIEVNSSGGVRLDGEECEVTLRHHTGHTWLCTLGAKTHEIIREESTDGGDDQWTIFIDGERVDVKIEDERAMMMRQFGVKKKHHSGATRIMAPMPGLINRILVREGDQLHAGQGVVVLEAMKMENELKTTAAGVVRAILIREKEAVEKNQLLIELA